MSGNPPKKLSLKERMAEASFLKYEEEFDNRGSQFEDMGRQHPLSKEKYKKEFLERWGTAKEDGPIYEQIINKSASGKVDYSLKRAAESYYRNRENLKRKGIALDTEEALSPMEFRDAFYAYQDKNALLDKPITNIGKSIAMDEQIYNRDVARKIAKLVRSTKDLELIEKYGRIKSIMGTEEDRGTVFQEVAEIVGYQAADEFIYSDSAARKQRTKDKPWFTTNEEGKIVDPFGKIIR